MVAQEVELHWAAVVGRQLNLAAQRLSVPSRIVQSRELGQGSSLDDSPELEIILIVHRLFLPPDFLSSSETSSTARNATISPKLLESHLCSIPPHSTI